MKSVRREVKKHLFYSIYIKVAIKDSNCWGLGYFNGTNRYLFINKSFEMTQWMDDKFDQQRLYLDVAENIALLLKCLLEKFQVTINNQNIISKLFS